MSGAQFRAPERGIRVCRCSRRARLRTRFAALWTAHAALRARPTKSMNSANFAIFSMQRFVRSPLHYRWLPCVARRWVATAAAPADGAAPAAAAADSASVAGGGGGDAAAAATAAATVVDKYAWVKRTQLRHQGPIAVAANRRVVARKNGGGGGDDSGGGERARAADVAAAGDSATIGGAAPAVNATTDGSLISAAPVASPISVDPVLLNLSYFVEVYGCQMNVSDAESVERILQQAGATRAATGDAAAIVLLQTCAVREKPELKVKQVRSVKYNDNHVYWSIAEFGVIVFSPSLVFVLVLF